MADVSPATSIDLPLERSLYVGNFFRAILYGELFSKLSRHPSLVALTHICG
jgi:hypothetical protein